MVRGGGGEPGEAGAGGCVPAAVLTGIGRLCVRDQIKGICVLPGSTNRETGRIFLALGMQAEEEEDEVN